MSIDEALREYAEAARLRLTTDDRGRTHVRLSGYSPVMLLLSLLAVGVMVAAFAYPIAAMLFSPAPVPTWLILTECLLTIALASAAARWRAARLRAGLYDLIIDDECAALSLPYVFGRNGPVLLEIDDVVWIEPAMEMPKHQGFLPDAHALGPKTYKRMHASPDHPAPYTGHRGEVVYAVVIAARTEDSAEKIHPIVKWASLDRARAFTFWLRERLGVPHESADAVP